MIEMSDGWRVIEMSDGWRELDVGFAIGVHANGPM